MDTFRGMITDNTKCKELNYHLLTHEDVIKLNIVPNNIVQDHSARYLNWIEYNGKLYHHKMFDLNDFIGSNLCKVINLRSAKYDLAMVKGYIQTISESFIEENKKYYNLKNIIGAYKRGISYANVNLRDFVTFL